MCAAQGEPRAEQDRIIQAPGWQVQEAGRRARGTLCRCLWAAEARAAGGARAKGREHPCTAGSGPRGCPPQVKISRGIAEGGAQPAFPRPAAHLLSAAACHKRKVHSLQEKIVSMKRQRGDSPQHSPPAKRQDTGYSSERVSSPFADRGGGAPADRIIGSPRHPSAAPGPRSLFPQKQPEREEPSFTHSAFNRHRSPFIGAGGSRVSTPDRREPSFSSHPPSRFAGFNL